MRHNESAASRRFVGQEQHPDSVEEGLALALPPGVRCRERRAPSAERRPRRLTRRGGGSSPCTHAASAAGRPAGLSRLRVARHSLVGSARGLAAAALLALSGALALPTTAQAQEIPPGLEVTLHLSDDAVLEDATPITVTATASPASPVPFTVEILPDLGCSVARSTRMREPSGSVGSIDSPLTRMIRHDEGRKPRSFSHRTENCSMVRTPSLSELARRVGTSASRVANGSEDAVEPGAVPRSRRQPVCQAASRSRSTVLRAVSCSPNTCSARRASSSGSFTRSCFSWPSW